MTRKKFTFNIQPAPGVNLFSWYLGALKVFKEELEQYEDVELVDDNNFMAMQDEINKPQILNILEKSYIQYKKYCPDLTFEKFLEDQTWILDLGLSEEDLYNLHNYKVVINGD